MSKPSYDEVVNALQNLVMACDKGKRVEYGVGGMTIDAQLQRTKINDVPAIAVADAYEILNRCK